MSGGDKSPQKTNGMSMTCPLMGFSNRNWHLHQEWRVIDAVVEVSIIIVFELTKKWRFSLA